MSILIQIVDGAVSRRLPSQRSSSRLQTRLFSMLHRSLSNRPRKRSPSPRRSLLFSSRRECAKSPVQRLCGWTFACGRVRVGRDGPNLRGFVGTICQASCFYCHPGRREAMSDENYSGGYGGCGSRNFGFGAGTGWDRLVCRKRTRAGAERGGTCSDSGGTTECRSKAG